MPASTHHPPGDTARDPRVGDFLLAGIKEQGIVSWAIKLGSWLRRYEAPYRRFAHVSLVVSEDGALIQARAGGVERSALERYGADDYLLVRTDVDDHDRGQVLEFANSVLEAKTKYGFATIFGLVVYCFTGAQLCIQQAGTAICSGFVCDALTRAGYIWPRPPYAMMPADLARYFDVRGEPGP